MFKEKWEPAEGTVSGSKVELVPGDKKTPARQARVYDIEIRRPGGHPIRTRVPELPGMTVKLAVGTAVRVEISARTGAVRFDEARPTTHINAGAAAGTPRRQGHSALATALGLNPGDGPAEADAEYHAAAEELLTELLHDIRTNPDRATAVAQAKARLTQLQADLAARRGGAQQAGTGPAGAGSRTRVSMHGSDAAQQASTDLNGGNTFGVPPSTFSDPTKPETFDPI